MWNPRFFLQNFRLEDNFSFEVLFTILLSDFQKNDGCMWEEIWWFRKICFVLFFFSPVNSNFGE